VSLSHWIKVAEFRFVMLSRYKTDFLCSTSLLRNARKVDFARYSAMLSVSRKYPVDEKCLRKSLYTNVFDAELTKLHKKCRGLESSLKLQRGVSVTPIFGVPTVMRFLTLMGQSCAIYLAIKPPWLNPMTLISSTWKVGLRSKFLHANSAYFLNCMIIDV
jgi:hypothetical protein